MRASLVFVGLSVVTGGLFAAATGCGGGDETGAGGAGGSGTGGSIISSSSSVSSSTSAASTGGGAPMDESTSCADAPDLESKTNNQGGTFYDYSAAIGVPGDIDYFKFQVQADNWYRIGTDVDPNNSEANTVVTLLSEDGNTQLAQNNNVVGGSNVESELFYHATASATLCMKVEDFSTFSGGTPAGSPLNLYRATMVPIDFDLYPYYTEDVGNNDSTAMPQPAGGDTNSSGQITAGLAGLLDPTDVDVYELVAPTGALDFNLLFTPPGPNGYGSTQDPGIISVYHADGSSLLAELDVQKGSTRFSSVPVVEGETYFVAVNWPQGQTASNNDFYFLKLFTSTTLNPQELNEAGNGSYMAAEAATPSPNGANTSYYIGGTLPVPDTDWWSFPVNAGQEIGVACSSWRAGSGVRDATVSLYQDPTAAALQSETEIETKSIVWSTSTSASKDVVVATTSGTHYLSISATQQDPLISSNHYLCGIHVTTP